MHKRLSGEEVKGQKCTWCLWKPIKLDILIYRKSFNGIYQKHLTEFMRNSMESLENLTKILKLRSNCTKNSRELFDNFH